MGIISKILANKFTYSTVQNRASQKGSKSRPHRILAYKCPPNAKNKNKNVFFVKTFFFEHWNAMLTQSLFHRPSLKGAKMDLGVRNFIAKHVEKQNP